jgi:quinolinate synthase
MNLPMAPSPTGSPALTADERSALTAEVRALAAERNAVILAHNYQVPEVQDAADYVACRARQPPPTPT